MVKENLKRQVWVLGLVCMTFLIFCPVVLLMEFDSWKASRMSYETMEKGYEAFLSLDRMGRIPILAVCAVIAVLCAVSAFSYLHSSKKLDCYHSLPVRRTQIYWQHVWTSLIIFAVPYLLSLFLAICVGATHGYFSLHILKAAAVNFAVYLIFFLLVYSVSVLAMLLTGRILVGILGAAVFCIYVPGVVQVFRAYASMCFDTYIAAPFQEGSLLWVIDHFGSPLSWGLTLRNISRTDSSLAPAVIGGLAAAVLLLLLNMWIYKRRPTEAAGRSMAFTKVGYVIQYLIEIPVVLGIGVIGHDMVSEHSTVWWLVSMAVGIVVLHGVLQVIYQADFRKFFSHLLHLGIAAAAVALICAVYKLDLTGYDSYLPGQERLASLDIRGNDLIGSYNVYMTSQGNRTSFSQSIDMDESYLKLKPDSSAYSMIQNVIEKGVRNQSSTMTSVTVRYSLANGKEKYRCYQMDLQELEKISKGIPNTEGFKEVYYPHLEEKNAYVEELNYVNGNYYSILSNGRNSDGSGGKNEMLKLLAKDVAEADENVFFEEPIGILNVSYHDRSQDVFDAFGYYYESESLLIYPGFQRTCAYLKEQGIPPKTELKAQEVEKIITYTWDDFGEQQDRKEYVDEDTIKTLLPSLRLSGTWTSWMEPRANSTGVEIIMKDKQMGDQGIQYGYCLLEEATEDLK